ncbi:MAG: hypothetical protein LBK01_08565 [Burkholderiaceae bacterium]|jgi:putative addiction module killer protein|nr:hypothetical protein [Burkholderiaceae bacterium]
MYTVRLLPEFSDWLSGLKDETTRRRLRTRLDRAVFGNLGDVKSVGENVWEMREFFGSGWRMYYTRRENTSHAGRRRQIHARRGRFSRHWAGSNAGGLNDIQEN